MLRNASTRVLLGTHVKADKENGYQATAWSVPSFKPPPTDGLFELEETPFINGFVVGFYVLLVWCLSLGS